MYKYKERILKMIKRENYKITDFFLKRFDGFDLLAQFGILLLFENETKIEYKDNGNDWNKF